MDGAAALLRQTAVAVWALLVTATAVSWLLGSDLGRGDDRTALSLFLLALACIKIRFVGVYFMELGRAPLALRTAFEVYALALFVLLSVFYLLG